MSRKVIKKIKHRKAVLF